MNYSLPTSEQRAWADCEIGVIIHLDMQVFDPSYRCFSRNPARVPAAEVFNPSCLNTDQWMECARSLGATYAVLVAKHGSGFAMWPTKAYPYSVAQSPWRGGQGDIVADFAASCRKYGIKPGLYASCGCNDYLGICNYKALDGTELAPEKRRSYAETIKTQLRELWSNYGDLFEIWFDGGCFPDDSQVKDDIIAMARALQPRAVYFQGDPKCQSTVRWIGNERGDAPYPCYSRVNFTVASTGVAEEIYSEERHGSLDGTYWAPGEADMTIRDKLHARDGGWFWEPGEDGLVYPASHIVDCYQTTVGRNCNLLLGMCIDDRGLVPDADAAVYRQAGGMIRKLTEHPLRGRLETSISPWNEQVFEFYPAEAQAARTLCLMEDLEYGENIRNFVVSGFDGACWHSLVWGSGVGHKFLARLPEMAYQCYQLKIVKCLPGTEAHIREYSFFE